MAHRAAPGRKGRHDAQRADLAIELPERHLHGLLRILAIRAGAAHETLQVRLAHPQQSSIACESPRRAASINCSWAITGRGSQLAHGHRAGRAKASEAGRAEHSRAGERDPEKRPGGQPGQGGPGGQRALPGRDVALHVVEHLEPPFGVGTLE